MWGRNCVLGGVVLSLVVDETSHACVHVHGYRQSLPPPPTPTTKTKQTLT